MNINESNLATAIAKRGVGNVVVYPSAQIDGLVEEIERHGTFELTFALSEIDAGWIGLAMAEMGLRRTAVLTQARFSLPLLSPVIELAVERHLPIDLICLGDFVFQNDAPPWWPIVGVDSYRTEDGPLNGGPSVVVSMIHSEWQRNETVDGELIALDPTVRVIAEELRSLVQDSRRKAATKYVIALPPVLHPQRRRLEELALDLQLQVVTTGGLDPFAREHPNLWLGRMGYVPSPRVVDLLKGPSSTIVITVPGVRLPSWIGTQIKVPHVTESQASESSAALRALSTLEERFPSAILVADAGAAHRYVAGALANLGKPALLTDGLTHMGWALPTTLGASLAAPEKTFITVLGDGSALINGTALASLAQHRVPAVVLLLDNGTLGARYSGNPRLGRKSILPSVDWVMFGESLGIEVSPWQPGVDSVLGRVDDAIAERRPFMLVVKTPQSHPDTRRFPIVIDGLS